MLTLVQTGQGIFDDPVSDIFSRRRGLILKVHGRLRAMGKVAVPSWSRPWDLKDVEA
jgi:hypothetical protein